MKKPNRTIFLTPTELIALAGARSVETMLEQNAEIQFKQLENKIFMLRLAQCLRKNDTVLTVELDDEEWESIKNGTFGNEEDVRDTEDSDSSLVAAVDGL